MAVLIVVNLYSNLLLHILFWSGLSCLSLVKNRCMSDPFMCILCCNFCTNWCGILTVVFLYCKFLWHQCILTVIFWWNLCIIYFKENPTNPILYAINSLWQKLVTPVNIFSLHWFWRSLSCSTFCDCIRPFKYNVPCLVLKPSLLSLIWKKYNKQFLKLFLIYQIKHNYHLFLKYLRTNLINFK